MANIKVADSVILSKANTPLDARCRVATEADILNIELPFVGLLVYVLDSGKFYTITAVKEKLIGAMTVAGAAVAEYEEFKNSAENITADKINIVDQDNRFEAENVEEALQELAEDLDSKLAADKINIVDQDNRFEAENVEEALQELAEDLDSKLAADKIGKANGVASLGADGKVPAAQLPELSGGKNTPSTITLPIPSDDDLDNISLVVDFSLTGEFNNNEDGSPADYSRVTMIDHYAQMRVFANEIWEPLTATSVGVPHYYGSVSFTLDANILPGYVPGTRYYARYTWLDSKGAYDGWIGFSFAGDVADLRPIRLPEKDSLSVKDLGSRSGDLIIDYADGEVQNIRLNGDATLDLGNVSGVIFGKALILNVDLWAFTLTVTGDRETMKYKETNRVYTVVISNFGKLQMAVSETL